MKPQNTRAEKLTVQVSAEVKQELQERQQALAKQTGFMPSMSQVASSFLLRGLAAPAKS